MLNTLLNIVITWVVMAGMFLTTFITMELIAFSTRPDYKDKFKKRESGKMSLGRFLLMWLVMWPVAAVGIINAMLDGNTFTEYLDDQNKKNEAAQAKAQSQREQVLADARKLVVESPIEWHEFGTPSMKIMLLVRNLSGNKIPTHMIYIPNDPDLYMICIHAMPESTDSVPFRFLDNQKDNLSDAMKLCIDDVDWAHLCVPGMERDRRSSWKQQTNMIRRRKKELSL